MDVALGGTFDPIHDGHRALFERAFSLGDATVGLTSDEFAPKTRHVDREIRPYKERKAALAAVLAEIADRYDREYQIRPIEDATGFATEPTFDVLVVSPETAPVGDTINEIRRERDLDPLAIEVVDHVLADDGKIISSTRILRGEIDKHGNVTSEKKVNEP